MNEKKVSIYLIESFIHKNSGVLLFLLTFNNFNVQ